jgi:hypothetical protein
LFFAIIDPTADSEAHPPSRADAATAVRMIGSKASDVSRSFVAFDAVGLRISV